MFQARIRRSQAWNGTDNFQCLVTSSSCCIEITRDKHILKYQFVEYHFLDIYALKV